MSPGLFGKSAIIPRPRKILARVHCREPWNHPTRSRYPKRQTLWRSSLFFPLPGSPQWVTHEEFRERHTVPLPTVPRSWVRKKEVSWCQDKWTGRTGKIISQCTSVYSRANTNPQWRRRRSRKYSRDCRYTDPPLTSPLLQHAVHQRLREPFRILKISPGTRSPFVVLVMVNTGKICGNVSVTRRHVTEKSSWNILAVRTMSQKQCLKN